MKIHVFILIYTLKDCKALKHSLQYCMQYTEIKTKWSYPGGPWVTFFKGFVHKNNSNSVRPACYLHAWLIRRVELRTSKNYFFRDILNRKECTCGSTGGVWGASPRKLLFRRPFCKVHFDRPGTRVLAMKWATLCSHVCFVFIKRCDGKKYEKFITLFKVFYDIKPAIFACPHPRPL